MKLEKLTITARASLNYNVGEVALEVTEFNKEDLYNVEKLVVQEAIKTVKMIDLGNANQPKQQAEPQVQVTKVKAASQAQISLLKKLGYTGSTYGLSSLDASNIINQLKGN